MLNRLKATRWTPLALTALYFACALLFLPRIFWENDNIGILDDAQLGYPVSFMSRLLGSVFSFLYLNISPTFPWYGVVMYLLAALAFWAALDAVDRICPQKPVKIGFGIFLVLAHLQFIIRLSYNHISIFAGFASLFALLVLLRVKEQPSYRRVFLLGVLFSFSFLVRTGGVRAPLLFAAWILGLELCVGFRKRILLYLVFALPVLAAIGSNALLIARNHDPRVEYFQAWNHLRGQFHDYSVAAVNAGNPDILQANGWSKTDYSMLTGWLYFDESRFNLRTLQNVFLYSRPLPGQRGLKTPRIIKAGRFLLEFYRDYWLAMVGLFLVPIFNRRRKSAVLVAGNTLLVILVVVVMRVFFRFPDRIGFSILLGTLLLDFFVIYRDRPMRNREGVSSGLAGRGRFLPLVIIVFVLPGILEAAHVLRKVPEYRTNQARFLEDRETLTGLDADFLVATSLQRSRRIYEDPLRTHDLTPRTVPMGWTIFSPRFYDALHDLGMERGGEIFPRLVDNPRAYLVADDHALSLILQYLRVDHGRRCRVRRVAHLDQDIDVISLSAP